MLLNMLNMKYIVISS